MELTAKEKQFLKNNDFPGVKFSNQQFYVFSGHVSRLYDLLHWHAKHGIEDDAVVARELLLKSIWHPHEGNISISEGWFIWVDHIEAAVQDKYKRFSNDEEAASHVKEAAVRGDVLAQKAVIEIARRRLNGNRKNDRFAEARNT